jgi:hypothetical protein
VILSIHWVAGCHGVEIGLQVDRARLGSRWRFVSSSLRAMLRCTVTVHEDSADGTLRSLRDKVGQVNRDERANGGRVNAKVNQYTVHRGPTVWD